MSNNHTQAVLAAAQMEAVLRDLKSSRAYQLLRQMGVWREHDLVDAMLQDPPAPPGAAEYREALAAIADLRDRGNPPLLLDLSGASLPFVDPILVRWSCGLASQLADAGFQVAVVADPAWLAGWSDARIRLHAAAPLITGVFKAGRVLVLQPLGLTLLDWAGHRVLALRGTQPPLAASQGLDDVLLHQRNLAVRKALEPALRVLAVTGGELRNLEETHRIAPWRCVGLDQITPGSSCAPPGEGSAGKADLVCAAGVLAEHAAWEELLAAFALLVRMAGGNELRLILPARPLERMEALRAVAATLRIEARVLFTEDWMDHPARLFLHMAAGDADFAVWPMLAATWGGVLAASMDVPVPPIPSIVPLDLRNPEAAAGRLRDLLQQRPGFCRAGSMSFPLPQLYALMDEAGLAFRIWPRTGGGYLLSLDRGHGLCFVNLSIRLSKTAANARCSIVVRIKGRPDQHCEIRKEISTDLRLLVPPRARWIELLSADQQPDELRLIRWNHAEAHTPDGSWPFILPEAR